MSQHMIAKILQINSLELTITFAHLHSVLDVPNSKFENITILHVSFVCITVSVTTDPGGAYAQTEAFPGVILFSSSLYIVLLIRFFGLYFFC